MDPPPVGRLVRVERAADLLLIRNALSYDLRRSRRAGAGYYFERGPAVRTIDLTAPQALALALAGQLAVDTDSVDPSVLRDALQRLEGALPSGIVPYLRRAANEPAIARGPRADRARVLATLRRSLAPPQRGNSNW